MGNKIDIPGTLHSTATGNVVVETNEVFDTNKGKKQNQLNTEMQSSISAEIERATGADKALSDRLEAVEQLAEISVEGGTLELATSSSDITSGSGKVPTANAVNEVLQGIGYFECSTDANVAAKTIAATGYSLRVGGNIRIKMTNANTADAVTLNINNTGAKALFYNGAQASSTNSWEAGEVVEVYYDGERYQCSQIVDDEPTAGSNNLVKSGGVYENIKEVIGYDGKLTPIARINYRLQNNNSSNYGYWYSNSQRSLIFDLSLCKGKSITIKTYSISNTYKYCIVSNYLSIPSSYDPEVFDPLVLLSGGKTVDIDVFKTYSVKVPETDTGCYLIVSCNVSHVNDVSVVCQENIIEPISVFKETVNAFMLEHKDDVKQKDILLTGTNYLGVMPAKTHRISSANVGSALTFGGSSGYQSSHEYLPVQEGEIYYLMYGYNNVTHAAVTDDNNIVVAAYTDSIHYAGLLRVEIPQGGKFLTWTTSGDGTLGWYVKVVDKKYDNYLLYGGEVKHYVPSEIQTASTDVVCTQSKHLVNGINMIDCEMNGTTSKIVIPVDYTKECKKGFYLYIDSSQIDKIASIAVNGNNLNVYSTFSYQDCFYLSCPIATSTSAIEITVTLEEGVTDDVTVAISSQMDVNKINKAVFCVNFDHSWQASVDSGAYDYIFNTAKFPVTITGTVDMSIYDFESLLANGMLEIGTYGGNQGFEQQCSHITEGCSMSVLNQHLDVKEDYYQDSFKIQPHTFGGRQHKIDRKIIFALKKNGYHSSRMRDYGIFGGANYGGVIINGFNIVSRMEANSSHGGVAQALLYQSAITVFAHGLSVDGSGSSETRWSEFKSKIDYAKQNVDNGAMLAMTFEQYYQTLLKFNLIANIC